MARLALAADRRRGFEALVRICDMVRVEDEDEHDDGVVEIRLRDGTKGG